MNKSIIDQALTTYEMKYGTNMEDIYKFVDICKSLNSEQITQSYLITFIPEIIELGNKKYYY